MKKIIFLVSLLTLILALVACSSSNGAAPNNESSGSGTNTSGAQAGNKFRLSVDYPDAVSVQTQLAVGTLKLEEGDLAVDQALAAELLPLWRAAQSLTNSDTAAEAEVQAVLNQIQDTMAPEQIAAITDMQLTEEAITTMQDNGELGFGGRGFGQNSGDGNDARGGFPDGGPGGPIFFGGPGGGPGGGGFPGGGPGGRGGFANLSEEEIATRRAEFATNGFSAFRDQAMMGAVVRLLEDKTGDLSDERLQADVFATAMAAVNEATGLDNQELRAQMAEGLTLAEVVAANGGDLDALQSSLVEIFSKLPNAADLDLEQTAADFLGLTE